MIERQYDQEKKNFIDIFTCDDPLYPEIKVCGTIGVSDHPNKIEINDNSFKKWVLFDFCFFSENSLNG